MTLALFEISTIYTAICTLWNKENVVKLLYSFLFWSQVRAGVKTFQPKEAKLIEENPKFNKKVISKLLYFLFFAVINKLGKT